MLPVTHIYPEHIIHQMERISVSMCQRKEAEDTMFGMAVMGLLALPLAALYAWFSSVNVWKYLLVWAASSGVIFLISLYHRWRAQLNFERLRSLALPLQLQGFFLRKSVRNFQPVLTVINTKPSPNDLFLDMTTISMSALCDYLLNDTQPQKNQT